MDKTIRDNTFGRSSAWSPGLAGALVTLATAVETLTSRLEAELSANEAPATLRPFAVVDFCSLVPLEASERESSWTPAVRCRGGAIWAERGEMREEKGDCTVTKMFV
jgi:hypothetical protein